MNMKKKIQPWRIEWTEENITSFWNWWGSNPVLAKHYFSRRCGEAVLDQVERYLRRVPIVVDLGAGPGFIVDLLVKRGIKTIAIDTSEESLVVLTERMRGNPNFLGARVSQSSSIPMDDGEADMILLIETVEHLSDQVLRGLLAEAHRVMKPGAVIVITTPNEENLAELETYCPNCGCVYHYYQHMRSWSVMSLSHYMNELGFSEMACYPTLFSSMAPHLRTFHRFAYWFVGMKLPHLLYVGRK